MSQIRSKDTKKRGMKTPLYYCYIFDLQYLSQANFNCTICVV